MSPRTQGSLRLGPRIVIAGTHSGVGKTTIATGIMAALARHGRRVAAAKVGPDFIDPGYHRVATGRPGRNLDVRLSGPEMIPRLAARASDGADILVIEGVMGLFDGVGASAEASTAHVAELLSAPVVLVIDASAMSGSVTALVRGYDAMLRDRHRQGLAGIIVNRVGSDTHEQIVRDSLVGWGIPLLGIIRRQPHLAWRDRHLGLIPVIEHPTEVASSVETLADLVSATLDLAAIETLATNAPSISAPIPPLARRVSPKPVPVAIAGGPAFSFAYQDNLEQLEAAGAELVPFDPLVDQALPDGVRALYAGGGFPEIFAEQLASNLSLLADVKTKVDAGLITWAECGGLLWLCRSLDSHSLCGVIDATAAMSETITIGYRTAIMKKPSPIAPAGARLLGHEHHYAVVDPDGDAMTLEGTSGRSIGGFASRTLLASFLHVHMGADGRHAEAFLGGATWGTPSARTTPARPAPTAPSPAPTSEAAPESEAEPEPEPPDSSGGNGSASGTGSTGWRVGFSPPNA